ncbi:MAG: 3,4-dihydroxy-2-butanone-4-phosphate synthase [Candidatus Nitrosocaldaceae archaeon]
MNIDAALESFKSGNFLLLHDGSNREDEVDMIMLAEYVKPEHIAIMRKDAGGLICVALDYHISNILGLRYMHDILNGELKPLIYTLTPYGEKPAFSLTINHKDTFTGVTDRDRALTISRIGKICKSKDIRGDFFSEFKSPGHVHLLIAREGLLKERNGHTELAIALTRLANTTPAVTLCEMLDDKTHGALSLSKARVYAEEHGLFILEAKEIRERYG